MKLSNIMNSMLSIFLIFSLVLKAHQALAYGAAIDRPVWNVAHSTLLSHDDLESQKAFHKASATSIRKKVKKFLYSL